MEEILGVDKFKTCIAGAGTMGSGIAQIAATCGFPVVLFDTQSEMLDRAMKNIVKGLEKQVVNQKISNSRLIEIVGNIKLATNLDEFQDGGILIEAIIEDPKAKRELFIKCEEILSKDAILATNTSSLSIVSIASGLKNKERFIGIHFFNPAPIMPLVEIIPGLITSSNTVLSAKKLIQDWKKISVIAKDTPGFIVNRVARPFYGEAIRIYEEGIADFSTIDWAMKNFGGFKMGPFELMDLIGNDINYKVTETVWRELFYDPKYKPSITQKRMNEAGLLGRKTGKGYYDYTIENIKKPDTNEKPGREIFNRILTMLINEAIEAVYLKIATPEDIDLAMEKGVNYPKGLLRWCDELGIDLIANNMAELFNTYGEERYRSSNLLKVMAKSKLKFYN